MAVGPNGVPSATPTTLPFATPAVASGPALLPPTGPANISANEFQAEATMDAAGSLYYMVLTAQPGAQLPDPGLEAGTWAAVAALPAPADRRRRRALQMQTGVAGSTTAHGRRLGEAAAQSAERVSPHTCPPAAAACSTPLATVFPEAVAGGAYRIVTSGCASAPYAGRPASLPGITGLQNGTVYYLLLASEGGGMAPAARMQPPAVYAVRTVDLSPPRFACGFPAVTNITSTGFAVSALLTKPAPVQFVVVSSQVRSAVLCWLGAFS